MGIVKEWQIQPKVCYFWVDALFTTRTNWIVPMTSFCSLFFPSNWLLDSIYMFFEIIAANFKRHIVHISNNTNDSKQKQPQVVVRCQNHSSFSAYSSCLRRFCHFFWSYLERVNVLVSPWIGYSRHNSTCYLITKYKHTRRPHTRNMHCCFV